MKNDKLKEQLHDAIMACAKNAENASNPMEALQYSQAALNATHALASIHLNIKD